MPHRLVTVAYVSVVAAGALALNHASEQRSQAKLRSSVNACEDQGNPARALDRLESRGNTLQRRERFQPIVDCHSTYFDAEGQPVPLAFEEQLRYIELIRQGIRPVIRADGTVAAE